VQFQTRYRFAAAIALWAMLPSHAHADCIAAAAAYHRIDVQLLQAIVMQESSGRAEAVNCANANASCDYGLAQINSVHLERLQRFGVSKQDLFNPCVSAYVGAWILAENFDRLGVTWDAVGAYNASTPAKRAAYANKIQAKLNAIRAGTLIPVRVPFSPRTPADQPAGRSPVAGAGTALAIETADPSLIAAGQASSQRSQEQH
jgi:soluble lytic murein transglycosylase-like protein